MRIVDVCGFYSEAGGGVRAYVRQKLAAAARAGHHVSVIAPGSRDRIESVDGGRITWLAGPPMPFDARYRRFAAAEPVWRAIDAERPDVIEGSSPWRSGWLARDWPGAAPRTLLFHQDVVAAYAHVALDRWLPHKVIDWLAAPWWARLRRLACGFDATLVAGDWLAKRLTDFGVERVRSVPFGVDRRWFRPGRRDPTLRTALLRQCGVGPAGMLLLAVGRFHPEKRWGVILEGFRHARVRLPNIALVVVGDGLAGKAVRRAAAGLDGVHLAGAISEPERLADIYASADLLLHGSGAETYGLVVGEAIASGMAAIAPDAGGAGDLVRRAGGRLYRLGRPGALASAIEAALGDPVPLNRSAVEDSSAHFARLFQLYAELVERRKPRRVHAA